MMGLLFERCNAAVPAAVAQASRLREGETPSAQPGRRRRYTTMGKRSAQHPNRIVQGRRPGGVIVLGAGLVNRRLRPVELSLLQFHDGT
jgi:hypothetical protein